MKIILALALLLPAIAAAAETVTALTASIASYHLNRAGDYCEINPGVGIEHGTAAIRGVAGLYHNSNCRPSGYLGISATGQLRAGWRAGVALLGLTGYHEEKKDPGGDRKREDKTILAPVLVLAYEGKSWGVNIGFIPPASLLGHDEKDKPEQDRFKGLVFLQAKVLKW